MQNQMDIKYYEKEQGRLKDYSDEMDNKVMSLSTMIGRKDQEIIRLMEGNEKLKAL